MGSVVAGRERDPGQEEKRMQGPGSGLGLNSSQGTMGPACLGTREQTHSALQVGATSPLVTERWDITSIHEGTQGSQLQNRSQGHYR